MVFCSPHGPMLFPCQMLPDVLLPCTTLLTVVGYLASFRSGVLEYPHGTAVSQSCPPPRVTPPASGQTLRDHSSSSEPVCCFACADVGRRGCVTAFRSFDEDFLSCDDHCPVCDPRPHRRLLCFGRAAPSARKRKAKSLSRQMPIASRRCCARFSTCVRPYCTTFTAASYVLRSVL